MGSGTLYDYNTSFLTLSKMIAWGYWSYNDPDPIIIILFSWFRFCCHRSPRYGIVQP